jgi:hypothetical protein
MARRRCPACSSPMTRIVWGYPGHELVEAEQRAVKDPKRQQLGSAMVPPQRHAPPLGCAP